MSLQHLSYPSTSFWQRVPHTVVTLNHREDHGLLLTGRCPVATRETSSTITCGSETAPHATLPKVTIILHPLCDNYLRMGTKKGLSQREDIN